MTTLSNMDIIAQFGWTMELIHNSTGGRVPKFWRPPYGDTDVRVSAIAHEVFGMTAILWNQEYIIHLWLSICSLYYELSSTEDWSLTMGGTTAQKISASMNKWLTGSVYNHDF
jgi:chitin deacetylase